MIAVKASFTDQEKLNISNSFRLLFRLDLFLQFRQAGLIQQIHFQLTTNKETQEI